MSYKLIRRKDVEPLQDYGFFGPDSVTWKVWSNPCSFALGFIRATTIEHFDPHLAAAVVDTGDVVARTATRYDRTMRYFALVKFGDSETATRASNVLVKVHAKAVGDDPVSGRRYDANDPDSQLWIHITAWHSILKCYEVFGPGKLTEADENQYWQECAVAAELQTIRVEDVPRSRSEVRAYFDAWRPKVAGSEAAQFMIDYILGALAYVLPIPPKPLRPLHTAVSKLHRRAVISTYPMYMRRLAGIRQGRVTDAWVTAVCRVIYRVLGLRVLRPALATLLNVVSPSTVAVAAPALFGIPPKNPRTVTPREARERLEVLHPREEYARFRALVEQRKAAGEAVQVGPEVPESLELIGPTAR